MSKEFKPWENPEQSITEALPERKTVDPSEGLSALTGIREKMGKVLKKDQALKISMYVPDTVQRKEGETWTDEVDGKMWERKGNINMSISKLRGAKRPYFCPKCEHIMKGRADDRMWILRGVCHRCVIKVETQIRAEGKWDRYERSLMMRNAIAIANEGIAELEGYRDMMANPQMHFQDGRFEEWDVNIDEAKAGIKEEIAKVRITVSNLEQEWKDNGFEEFELLTSVAKETEK